MQEYTLTYMLYLESLEYDYGHAPTTTEVSDEEIAQIVAHMSDDMDTAAYAS